MDNSMLNSLKQQYVGKYFKWIRPVTHETMGNMIEPGDIVRCTNVRLRESDNTVLAEFHMGPPISVNLLHSHLEPYNSDNIITPDDNMYESMGVDNPHRGATGVNPNGMMNPDEIKSVMSKTPGQAAAKPVSQNNVLFEKFSTAETKINVGMSIKMPSLQLIQMMYSSAADKDEFINDLSSFVMEKITLDNVKDSLLSMIGENAVMTITNDPQ